jgi:tetratricopeptide (TPR) repeat protein
MKKMNLLRMSVLVMFAMLLAACGSMGKAPVDSRVDVPVEERDHGAVSSYRIVPALPEQQPDQRKVPSSAVAHLHADARKQFAAKQYNAAASTLERALRIAPRNAELWYSLAVVRLQQQRWEMARNMAAKSNSFAAANRELQAKNWRVIANSHQAQGNQQAAQKAWQRARQLGGS